MESTDEQRAHLRRLAEELTRRAFTADVPAVSGPPHLAAANPDAPELHEKVLCRPAEDGSWCFWWPWKQPIGSVDDVAAVAEKIATVLRSVEGEPPPTPPPSPEPRHAAARESGGVGGEG